MRGHGGWSGRAGRLAAALGVALAAGGGGAGCFNCGCPAGDAAPPPEAGPDPCPDGEDCFWGDTRCAGETVETCTIVERPFCSWYEPAGDCSSFGLVCEGGACIARVCGDGWVSTGEGCDDGGLAPGDGCDEACAVEPSWRCDGEPSACCRDECPKLGLRYCDAGGFSLLVCAPGPLGCLAGELVTECASAEEQCLEGPGGAGCATPPVGPPSSYALAFDGIDDVVDCGALSLALPLPVYTLELWLWLEPGAAVADDGVVVQKRPDACGAPEACSFRLMANGACVSLEPCGDGPLATCGTTITPCEGCDVLTGECGFDGWHHFAFVNDETTDCSTIVVDGASDACTGWSLGALGASDWPLLFGRLADCAAGCSALSGAIDEVRLWGYRRTGAEIVSTMYTGLAGDEPGLVAYWPFDEGGDGALEAVTGTSCRLGDAVGPDPADPSWWTDVPF